jgi:3-phosphoshikimate 1-carboxyvinyltransferase
VSDRRVGPATHVDAAVTVPGDKSMSHRALLLGALARGRSYVGNCSPAADVERTLECLRACGVWIRPFGGGRVALDGAGPGESLRAPAAPLDCGNSGTTMRLLAGALASHEVSATLDGDASLRRRPMERVAAPLRAMGAEVVTSSEGTAPLRVTGTRSPQPIDWLMPVASAQVKSAILLAALSAPGRTSVDEPRATRDHTERMLRMCGIDVRTDGLRVTVEPGIPSPFGFLVPGDISSAAFFFALAAARPGWRVRCAGVGLNPGRTGILDVLRAMGADVEVAEGEAAGGVEPQGDVEVRGAALRATTVAGSLTVRCIDEIPVVCVLATQAEGTTEIRDAGELRTKETDRIDGIAAGLRALGATCETAGDGIAVTGPARLRPASLDSGGDHRLAMAWAIAAALAGAHGGVSTLRGADAASVSYPGFFEDLASVTGAG